MSGLRITRTVTLLFFTVAVVGLLQWAASYYDEGRYQDAACWMLFAIAHALIGLLVDRLIEAQG